MFLAFSAGPYCTGYTLDPARGKPGELVFDVACPPDVRQAAAARAIFNLWRAYKLRRHAIAAVLQPKSEDALMEYARRWSGQCRMRSTVGHWRMFLATSQDAMKHSKRGFKLRVDDEGGNICQALSHGGQGPAGGVLRK